MATETLPETEILYVVLESAAGGPIVSAAPRTAKAILGSHPRVKPRGPYTPEELAQQCVEAGQWREAYEEEVRSMPKPVNRMRRAAEKR